MTEVTVAIVVDVDVFAAQCQALARLMTSVPEVEGIALWQRIVAAGGGIDKLLVVQPAAGGGPHEVHVTVQTTPTFDALLAEARALATPSG